MTGIRERLSRAVLRPRPPGPRGLDLVRTGDGLRRNGLATMERLARTYGDIVYINLAGRHMFMISHPDFIEQVVIRNSDNYIKSHGSAWTRRFFGNAMQLNNGEYARGIRRIMAPVFHHEALASAYCDMIVSETLATMDKWGPEPRPALTQELTALALDTSMGIFFGTEPGDPTHP